MKTYVIGESSNLSKSLQKVIQNSALIPTLSKNFDFEDGSNIIFNNFQASTKLNSISSYEQYINYSINSTSKILDFIQTNKLNINKIIYTSSSSVYGNLSSTTEEERVDTQSLYASLKFSNEKIIEKFCIENHINYTIARIFNMYGGNDSFSIISKIITAAKTNNEITLINNGQGIRDFIHVDDVSAIYKQLLFFNNIPIVNIGTGIGRSIASILKFLEKNGLTIKTKSITKKEINKSIADVKLLQKTIGNYNFKCLDTYILNSLV
ncbi:MAG: NAD-dependent epimerase/dehydratase family protein [Campylobacteraceae bacterium]